MEAGPGASAVGPFGSWDASQIMGLKIPTPNSGHEFLESLIGSPSEGPTAPFARAVSAAAATSASARARRPLKAAGGFGEARGRRRVMARSDGRGLVERVAVMGVVAVMTMVGSDEGLTKGGWAQRCFWRSSGCSRGFLPIMMAHAVPLDPTQWPGLRDMKAQWSSITPSITDTWVEDADCSNYNNVHCNAAGFVTQLDLTNRRLTGSLPGTIGVFVNLQYFYETFWVAY
ncbi:unnamed protein product [Closterium sp. NIES-65]|nr:unnamed protein product [Closterium sp. NIES-65]